MLGSLSGADRTARVVQPDVTFYRRRRRVGVGCHGIHRANPDRDCGRRRQRLPESLARRRVPRVVQRGGASRRKPPRGRATDPEDIFGSAVRQRTGRDTNAGDHQSPVEFLVLPEEFFGRAACQIPGAHHVALAPGDAYPIGDGVDDVIAEISQFLTGEVRLPAPERQICAILFTDLVGSTRRAESEGDAAWRQLLDRHDAVNRTAVSRRGGEVIKTTGDGVLALLPSATAAIEAAQTIRAQLRDENLEVRVGIHVGEIDRRGDDVSGLSVNIAARIMASAQPNQILTSAGVAQLTDAAHFTSLGPRTLKGLDGNWELFTVE